MGSAEVLHFQFAQHDSRALRRMNQLRLEERFCDVTIVAERLRFPGHRVVLAACSPFLRDQFLLNPSREVRVALGERPEPVSRLLLCCYTGALHFPFTDVINYLTAASHLQMEHVVQECRRALSRYVDPRIEIVEGGGPGPGEPRAWAAKPEAPEGSGLYVVIEPDSEPSGEGEQEGESSASEGVLEARPEQLRGHKLFGCPRCAKTFSQRVNLARHGHVHTGVKPYRCPTCGKTFTQNRSLKDHMNLHSGERPHRCLYCRASFAHKPALRRHLKEQHSKTSADNTQLARLQPPGPSSEAVHALRQQDRDNIQAVADKVRWYGNKAKVSMVRWIGRCERLVSGNSGIIAARPSYPPPPGVARSGFRSATRRSLPQRSAAAATRSRGSAARAMASAKLLRFQFPEHEGSTLRRMNQLRMEEWFCDVTIVVGGLRFPGHRVVLAACSPFLRDRFHMDPSREVQVCPMAGAEVVLRLLLSCYTGALEFPFRDIVDYLAAASCLQMEHVVEKCRQSLSPCVASLLTEEGDGRPATPQIASSSGRAPEAWPGPEGAVKQEEEVRPGGLQTPPPATPSEPDPRIHSTVGPVGAGGGARPEDEASAGATDDLPDEDYESSISEGLQRGPEEPAPPPGPGPEAEPARCSECAAAFEQREHLAAHMVTHRLYMCLLCGKVFKKNARLAQHINVHTGFKPYCCAVCGRTFTQKRSLKDHMNVHNGDSPHCCNYCDMRFTHYNTLRVHLRDQHGKTTTSNSTDSRLAEIKVVVP
ncbi:uncharacterized protein LOC127585794 [Pristis pectinata]|uniref:uncharacterized protein LOC127585794 n=1 Tax=Pristis pectinata TaxID=685728 RepID=UPI00223CCA01|nr:uncharacterized protein LOC127585794 [Pristis pectinata]